MPEVEEALETGSEEELLEEDTETTVVVVTKKRLSLEESNVYVHVVDEADQKKLGDELQVLAESVKPKLTEVKYTNGNPVDEKWRVIAIVQGATWDETSGKRTGGKLIAFVLAPNSGFASEKYLESKNYDVGLALKKSGSGRGRQKSKIEPMIKAYGILLEKTCFGLGDDRQTRAVAGNFVDGVTKEHKEEWSTLFARPGGDNAHYREDNGDWKVEKVKEEKEEKEAA